MKKRITIAFTDGTSMVFDANYNEIQKDNFGMIFHIHGVRTSDPSSTKDILIPWSSILSLIIDEVPEDDN